MLHTAYVAVAASRGLDAATGGCSDQLLTPHVCRHTVPAPAVRRTAAHNALSARNHGPHASFHRFADTLVSLGLREPLDPHTQRVISRVAQSPFDDFKQHLRKALAALPRGGRAASSAASSKAAPRPSRAAGSSTNRATTSTAGTATEGRGGRRVQVGGSGV